MAHATPEGCARFFARRNFRNEAYRAEHWHCRLPNGLISSRLGMGTYRMALGSKEHHEALREALLYGINVIDTALNFAGGKSIDLVGAVLTEMLGAGRIGREEIILISKAGLLEGALLEHYKKQIGFYPLNEKQGYSLKPEILAEQIDLSCKRLGQSCIDLFLLQNPERLLQAGMPPAQFQQELRRALQCMEEMAEQRRIQHYGLALNQPLFFTAVSASDLLQMVGPAFLGIQYPCNALEKQFHTQILTALEETRKKEYVWLIGNRPLNAAASDGSIRRLAGPVRVRWPESIEAELQTLLAQVTRLETELAPPGARFHFDGQYPALSALYNNLDGTFSSGLHFRANRPVLASSLQKTLQALLHFNGKSDTLEYYREICNRFLSLWEEHLLQLDPLGLEEAREAWVKEHPGLADQPLSVTSIGTLLANPWPQTVLCGMRRPSYVRQLTALFSLDPGP